MKKNTPLISISLMPHGIKWRLGFFLSFFCLLFSTSIYASENLSYEVETKESIEEDNPNKPPIYISEGTIVYGLNEFSVSTVQKTKNEKKNIKKSPSKKPKNFAVQKKTLKSEKSQIKINVPLTDQTILPCKSQNSFNISKQYYVVGTLTQTIVHKNIILTDEYKIPILAVSDSVALYIYSTPYKSIQAKFFSFTRPPPFS